MARKLVLALLAVSAGGSAQIIGFDNTSTYQGTHFPHLFPGQGTSEIELGDQISLSTPGLTMWMISVWFRSTGTLPGTVDIKMTFYANDGPEGAPGTVIYDGGWFGDMVHQPGLTQIDFEVPHIVAPKTFTWAVQLANRAGSNGEFGAAYFDPPTIGSSDDFIWISEGGSPWTQYSWGAMPVANFGARVHALVPEPATIGGLAIGLLALGRMRARAK